MRVLLDECVPRGRKRHLPGHEVQTVPEAGWSGVKNGLLLTRAEGRFDVLLTTDQGVEYQQNLQGRDIAVLVLCAKSNDISDLIPLVPAALAAIPLLQKGQLRKIPAS
jgi:hypothetical protein